MKYKYLQAVFVTSLYSQISFSAGPVPFGGWVVNSGSVDTSQTCNNVNVECKTLAVDDGFAYEEVTINNYKYLRLVLTDEQASGTADSVGFFTETFMPFALVADGDKQGIAARQVVRDPADGYELVADIQKGSMRLENVAAAEDMFSAKISQSISKADFSANFENRTYTQFATNPSAGSRDTDAVIGRKTDIDQTIKVDIDKQQRIVSRKREGVQGTTATSWSDGFYFVKEAITTGGSVNLGAENVSWIAGDAIRSTWLVQDNNVPDENAIAISTQTFENLSSQVQANDILMNISTPLDPFVWDTDLGVAPAFP